MGFIDKAKDAIGKAADVIKDPDGKLVEHTWPAGGPDEEHTPEDELHDPTDRADATEPVQGADPELDNSLEDQYEEDEQQP